MSRAVLLLSVLLAFNAGIGHSFKLSGLSKSPNALEDDSSTGAEGRPPPIHFRQGLGDDVTEVTEGESVVLECEAGGSPVPTIHWLFKGDRVLQGQTHSIYDDVAHFEHSSHNHHTPTLQLGNTRSRLVLDCVSGADAGLYQCVAETPTFRTTTTTYLQVDPSQNSCSQSPLMDAMPARVYMWEAHRLEFEGADVQLYCRAEGYPAPEVTWEDRNGVPISKSDSQYRILKNGDLMIKSVDWLKHMGQYRCLATNTFGQDSVTSFVYPTQP